MLRSSLILSFALFQVCLPLLKAQDAELPVSGVEVPELRAFDRMMIDLLKKYEVVGGAFAMADPNGRLLMARGYGWADKEAGIPVEPGSLFRFASLSKLITSTAVHKLIDSGELDATKFFLDVIPELAPKSGVDPRVQQITIRQLMQHIGGWDRDVSHDWVDDVRQAGDQFGQPVTPQVIATYCLSKPLDFNPGARYAYSNVGYILLARIIEKVSGRKFEDYVRHEVLAPLGVTNIRLGRTLDTYPDEVRYYMYAGAPLVQSIVPGTSGLVPQPYGGIYIESRDGNGGFIGSVVDYLRFFTGFDGRRGPALLKPDTLAGMFARPPAPLPQSGSYRASGPFVTPVTGGMNFSQDGGQPGVRSWVIRYSSGRSYVAVVNTSMRNDTAFMDELTTQIGQIPTTIATWPMRDQFGRFPQLIARHAAAMSVRSVSPNSLITLDGAGFNSETAVRIANKDAAVVEHDENRLLVVVPDETPNGDVSVVVRSRGVDLLGSLLIEEFAPGLFSADRTGSGTAWADLIQTSSEGSMSVQPLYQCAEIQGPCQAVPVKFVDGSQYTLQLYATGLSRVASTDGAVRVFIRGGELGPSSVSSLEDKPGIDVVSVVLPASLAGTGVAMVQLVVGEQASNAVVLRFD